MATILNNKKSTYGSPYCYYTVEYTDTTNRTATTVDITFKITSHLAYSSSSLGGGYTLKAQLYINGAWSSNITLKGSGDSWSGTTPHTKTQTITIENLASTDTLLEDIMFKVTSNASDKASGLNSTSCNDITIPMGHTPPLLTAYTMTEASSSPVYNVVDNNVIAENLSIKQFVVTYELFDDATINRVGIYNEIYPYSTTTFTTSGNQVTFTLDCSQFSFVKSTDDNTKIPIVTRMLDDPYDTMGVYPSFYTPDLYTYIPYTPPTIIESNVVTKRAGQLTGEATLSLDGTYYKSTDVLNQSNNIVVGFKYWENKENPDIPANYTTIPSASVTINNDGTFSVSSYIMGNDFDPEKSYRVLVKVSDAYKSYELSEPKSIAVGEALWTEYKDRVDFKKLTIKGNEILYKNIITANAKTAQTLSTTSWTKVPVQLTNSVGDKLEISNDGIKVLSDGYVYASANILFTSGTNATRRGVSIYVNDTQITYCNTKGDTTYTGASITPLLIPVSENDIIYLYAINQGASDSVISTNDTYLNVEVVQ